MALLDELFVDLKAASESWAGVYSLLNETRYETSASRSAMEATSVDNLHRRAIFIFELLNSLHSADEVSTAIELLAPRVNDLRNSLRVIKKNSDGIVNHIKPHIREGVTIRDTNNNFSLSIVLNEAQIAALDVSPNFQAIHTSLNQISNILLPVTQIHSSKGGNDFLGRAQALSMILASANQTLGDIKKLSENIKKDSDEADGIYKRIQEHFEGAQAIHSKLTAIQQQGEKDSASVAALIEKIKTIGVAADTLEKQVTGYAATFKAFQEQLDDRTKAFNQFAENTKNAIENNKKREGEIDRLTAKADSMIRGATTAGLSKSLDDSREIYAGRMFWARVGFLASIAALAVSALPLAADLLPGLFGELASKLGSQNDSYVPIVGKIFLLFPATWLTLFFAKSYSEFFHLEREYAHKAALAKSIEGFKREAPSFAEVITSSVFAEILSNPSNRPSPEPAQHPLYDALLNKLPSLLSKKS